MFESWVFSVEEKFVVVIKLKYRVGGILVFVYLFYGNESYNLK